MLLLTKSFNFYKINKEKNKICVGTKTLVMNNIFLVSISIFIYIPNPYKCYIL